MLRCVVDFTPALKLCSKKLITFVRFFSLLFAYLNSFATVMFYFFCHKKGLFVYPEFTDSAIEAVDVCMC